jgi:Putative lumazine-binding
MTPRPDFDAVSAAVQDYFQGMYNSDETRLRRAFHPRAQMFGHWNGPLLDSDLDTWMEEIAATPAPASVGEAYDMYIVSVDVTADKIAFVKVRDAYLGRYYTDYLTLAVLDGRWVIVNKVFHYDA